MSRTLQDVFGIKIDLDINYRRWSLCNVLQKITARSFKP